MKHFVTLIGEPAYETWLEFPNYTAMDENESRAKGFVNDPEWEEMMSQMSVYFERLAFVRSGFKHIGSGVVFSLIRNFIISVVRQY